MTVRHCFDREEEVKIPSPVVGALPGARHKLRGGAGKDVRDQRPLCVRSYHHRQDSAGSSSAFASSASSSFAPSQAVAARTIDHAGAMTTLRHRTSTLVLPPRTLPRRAKFDDIVNKEEEEEMKWVTTATVMDGWITIWGGVED